MAANGDGEGKGKGKGGGKKKVPLDPNWFKNERACRPKRGGHYQCVGTGCFYSECCARRQVEFAMKAPPNGSVISVRQVHQENSVNCSFPR